MKLAVIGRNSAELKRKLEHRAGTVLCEPGSGVHQPPGPVPTPCPGLFPAAPPGRKKTGSHPVPFYSAPASGTQLEQFFAGALKHSRLFRLEGRFGENVLYAMNDIFIHNRNNASALRYKIWIDGELYSHEIVGDGVGVATVHGSTAYFRSITHSVFRVGIGLAFSNSTELVNHLVLPESSVIRVKINRGPGEIVADNFRLPEPMNVGDECVIHLSEDASEFLGLDVFMCPVCRRLRHRYRRSIFNPEDPK